MRSVEELLEKYGLKLMVSLSSLGLGFCSARPAAHRWDVADAEPELSQVNTTGSVGRRLENLS